MGFLATFTHEKTDVVALLIDGRGISEDCIKTVKDTFFRFLPSSCHFYFVVGTEDQAQDVRNHVNTFGIASSNPRYANLASISRAMNLSESEILRLSNIQDYSRLLMNRHFWSYFLEKGYEYCLILQSDVSMFQYFPVEQYIGIRYIGAPWVNSTADSPFYVCRDNFGNGGCSFRHIRSTLYVLERYPPVMVQEHIGQCVAENSKRFGPEEHGIVEDVFFSWAFSQYDQDMYGTRMPTRREAFLFSLETCWPEPELLLNDKEYMPIFGHQLDRFFPNALTRWTQRSFMP